MPMPLCASNGHKITIKNITQYYNALFSHALSLSLSAVCVCLALHDRHDTFTHRHKQHPIYTCEYYRGARTRHTAFVVSLMLHCCFVLQLEICVYNCCVCNSCIYVRLQMLHKNQYELVAKDVEQKKSKKNQTNIIVY